ncbi:MAG: hypothetical protein WCE75_03450 [Terracidiphilus sp.]
MNAYLCVYRQREPSNGDRRKTEREAEKNPLVAKFLEGYKESFYDWGDDPSFFAAKELLGDVRRATWGVCRRDVRGSLNEGDVVVFFCGRQLKRSGSWSYYFIGFGTVLEVVRPRDLLWTKRKYAPYRKFYNVLMGPDGKQRETFHPFHDENWKLRADAPYVLFDPEHSAFNLDSPHLVASWNGDETPETWRPDRKAREIERLLFTDRGIIKRRLRTSRTGFGHAKLNLLFDRGKVRPGRPLADLTFALEKLL